MPTIEALQRAIKETLLHPQFVEWWGDLAQQIIRLEPGRGGKYYLWWSADVSGGCRQATTPSTTQID